jgi:hypothetical protein
MLARKGLTITLVSVLAALGLSAAGARLLGDRRKVFFGITVPQNDLAQLRQSALDAGVRPTVDNVFVKLDSMSFSRAQLAGIRAQGMQPMVSLEPWSHRSTWGDTEQPDYRLATITAGSHDAALRRIARAIAQYREPVLLRFAQEMNGWWYPWAVGRNGNRSSDYIAAWRHVHVLFQAEAASNARFLWSPNAITGSARETQLQAAYPGDEYVDLVGMTAYGHSDSPADTFDATYRRLAALTGKDIVLSETGVDGDAKASWISALGPWLAAHDRIAGFIWFNTSPASTGASGDYRFNDSPAALLAFRKMLGQLPLDAPSS